MADLQPEPEQNIAEHSAENCSRLHSAFESLLDKLFEKYYGSSKDEVIATFQQAKDACDGFPEAEYYKKTLAELAKENMTIYGIQSLSIHPLTSGLLAFQDYMTLGILVGLWILNLMKRG